MPNNIMSYCCGALLLQAGLLREGCYPGEEEMEDWIFGDQTFSALLTFQVTFIRVRSGRQTSSAVINSSPYRQRALFCDTSGVTCCPVPAKCFMSGGCLPHDLALFCWRASSWPAENGQHATCTLRSIKQFAPQSSWPPIAISPCEWTPKSSCLF